MSKNRCSETSGENSRGTPIPSRRLRVVIYARYSTEEQDASSIADQVDYCRDFLRSINLADAEITIYSDEGISGELRNRTGIDHIWNGITRPDWDILICEDCSRLFRNQSACMELAETANDNGMRIICINDGVDSVNENWHELLSEAAGDHARANHYLRRRIRRKIIGLWRQDAAVSQLKPGYKRNYSVPASLGQPAKGPCFDVIDEKWSGVILEGFERIANDEPAWIVAKMFTEAKLPKYGNSTLPDWTDREVITLIRQPLYRGLDRHRLKIVKKLKRTGKKRMLWNESDVWEREMPHLRIVPDALWYRANSAIDKRRKRSDVPRGAEHPLHGIPRDSRGPLSDEIFICGVCEEKMHVGGRNEGGYRCRDVRHGACWNKATALRAFTHQQISSAIGERLLAMSSVSDAMVDFVEHLCVSDDHRQRSIESKDAERRELLQKQRRLLNLATSTDTPPTSLVDQLRCLDGDLARTDAELKDLQDRAREHRPDTTREQILAALRVHRDRLITMGREAGVTLKQLIPDKIRAVPYRQFGSNLVVLRAEFAIRIVNLLPGGLLSALQGQEIGPIEWMQPINFCVNLFEPSTVPANAIQALAMRESESPRAMSYRRIGVALGISKRNAVLAVKLGEEMRVEGIVDPYIRLTEPPDHASRWRKHKKFEGDSEQRAAS